VLNHRQWGGGRRQQYPEGKRLVADVELGVVKRVKNNSPRNCTFTLSFTLVFLIRTRSELFSPGPRTPMRGERTDLAERWRYEIL
jgi:hypothetical protein